MQYLKLTAIIKLVMGTSYIPYPLCIQYYSPIIWRPQQRGMCNAEIILIL